MEKKKILFITPSLCQGGIEHYQITMLNVLDQEKYDITLLLYLDDLTLLPLVPEHVRVIVDKDENHYFRRPRALQLKILKHVTATIGKKSLSEYYGEQLKSYVHNEKMKHPARDLFAEEQFDVVVSNAIGRATEMAVYINAKKRYVFFHSSVDLHHDLLETLFPKYDGIIAVSDGVKTMLQGAYPRVRDKVFLLENYVDADEIIIKGNEETDLAFSHNKIRLASCGRLSPEKGFDMASRSAAIIKARGYDFHWIFIGDGSEREKVENIIRENELENYITITGYTDNPFPLIKECDVYVQPSYEEAYGRTIKEAMILGRPIVSTSTTGGKTLVDNGKTGILTDINEVALAESIITLIDNWDLRDKYRSCYSKEQNLKEKQIFIEKLENFLQ